MILIFLGKNIFLTGLLEVKNNMAWQPPEDELDTNVLQQSKPPEDELVKNIPDQWSPPEDELDNSPTKIKDAGTLQQMKQSGQELTREQERILFDAEDKKDFTQKASEAITTFVPTGIEIAKQLGTGAGEFLYKGILKPNQFFRLYVLFALYLRI